MISRFRRELFALAAGASVDLIFTFVYAHPVDAPEVRAYIEPVQAVGGRTCFVQLSCARDVLLARVQDESRHAHGKIIDSALLLDLLEHYDLLGAVPFGESLRIDTTEVRRSPRRRRSSPTMPCPPLRRPRRAMHAVWSTKGRVAPRSADPAYPWPPCWPTARCAAR